MSTKGQSLTEELAEYLLEDQDLYEEVEERLWNLKAPVTNQTPYIVMSRVSGNSLTLHDGPSEVEDVRFQLALYSENVSTLDKVRDLINSRIDGFRGTMGSLNVGFIFFENEVDGYESKSEYKFKILDYRVRLNG